MPTTIAYITVSLELTLAGVQCWFWWQDRTQRALADWTLAHLVAAAGILLIALRGEVPDVLSIDIANAMIILGYGLICTGVRRFEGRAASMVPALLATLVWLAACRTDFVSESLDARIVLMSVIGALFSALPAADLRRPRPGVNLPSRRPLFLMLILTAAGLGVRGALAVVFPVEVAPSGLPESVWLYAVIAPILMLRAATSILLISLSREAAEARVHAAIAETRDRADQANARKSRFLARMSHELRTPLNGVLGMAQVLADDPTLNDTHRARAAVITQAGRHLLGIVNDLLDIERVETGRIELSSQPIDIGQLLAETPALIGVQAEAKGLLLTVELDAALPAGVHADPLRVRQMVLNLLGNAVKFTPAGGAVTLSASAQDGVVRIAVTDTGPGVAEELRGRLFQDYARGVGTGGIEGSGLGLSITAALARAMGGTVGWEPGPNGHGSVFVLSLPLPTSPLAAAFPIVPPAPSRRSSMTVLVVDDVTANRRVVEALLAREGHAVIHAASGEAALDLLRDGPVPDLVLMDLDMPQMDGYATTARIRQLTGPAARIIIIAVTGHTHPMEVRACLAAGMDGHLAKPIDPEELNQKLDQLAAPAVAQAAKPRIMAG
ncbi:signal transduction histidine kinase [Humitalea rosea]|uniref:histidine kinase n=1 Tax=Humitalea rosea TaxID=990373 RepID=A0A2W7KPY2_9PROT|nr:response regulator [Humitalea rosea]PZW50385.1 signal transduction histidine kinase [Humitalea rosea]